MPSSSKIVELRQLLAVKYPAAAPRSEGLMPTGLNAVDALLQGGLALGGMTEIVCPEGGGLLLSALMRVTLERKGLMALVDGTDSFDPEGMPKAALRRLLWVRSKSAVRAVQAADLLLRDGNLGLVVMDLRSNSQQETSRVPASSWYRLQRVVEPTATVFVVLTHQPVVCSARPRLIVRDRFALPAIQRRQTELVATLNVDLVRGMEEHRRWYA